MSYSVPYTAHIVDHYRKRNNETIASLNSEIYSYTWGGNSYSQDLSFKTRASQFAEAVWSELGIVILVYDGWRSWSEQEKLFIDYQRGAGDRAEAPVRSWHPLGMGIDAVPIKPDGTADWNSNDWSQIYTISNRF